MQTHHNPRISSLVISDYLICGIDHLFLALFGCIVMSSFIRGGAGKIVPGENHSLTTDNQFRSDTKTPDTWRVLTIEICVGLVVHVIAEDEQLNSNRPL